MAGSLANLIQEVQQVKNSFSAVEEGIKSNQDAIQKLAENLSAQTEELTSGMGEMSDDFNKQMKTIGQTLDDQDNKSLRARKNILDDFNNFKDEFSKLKGKVTSLNNDINSLEGDIKAINKKVDNIPTGE